MTRQDGTEKQRTAAVQFRDMYALRLGCDYERLAFQSTRIYGFENNTINVYKCFRESDSTLNRPERETPLRGPVQTVSTYTDHKTHINNMTIIKAQHFTAHFTINMHIDFSVCLFMLEYEWC